VRNSSWRSCSTAAKTILKCLPDVATFFEYLEAAICFSLQFYTVSLSNAAEGTTTSEVLSDFGLSMK
jgi:hypothetical protein